MNVLLTLFGLGLALLGQKFNANPKYDSRLVKLALTLVGLAFYIPVDGLPHGWWGAPLFAWLDNAWVFALALPGAASLIGSNVPGMKTQDAPRG